jgi:hypothetical protein
MVKWNAKFLSFQKEGMMLKRFSHRAMRSFAVACLTLAVVCLGGAEFANSALFSNPQQLAITGAFPSNLSQVCRYDYNTGAFPCYNAFFGSYTLTYPLGFGTYYGFFLYDHNQARWVEALIAYDVPL